MATKYLKTVMSMIHISGVFNDGIFLIMAALFVSGLALSYSFVENAVSGVMIDYVPLDWTNKHLSKAAMIVGFLEGLSSIMVFVVAYLCDAYIGRYRTVLWSTFLNIMGLLILGLSTLLASLETRLPVFFIAGVLISIGKAGRKRPLREFINDQISLQEQINLNNRAELSFRFFSCSFSCDRVEFKTLVFWSLPGVLGALASVVVTSTSTPIVSCLGSAFVMGVAYLVFLSGVYFYIRKTPTGIPLSLLYKIFRGAFLHMISQFFKKNCGMISSQFFKNNCGDELPTIVESSTPPINQVMLRNMLSKMFPMWATFVVYSLVQTTGSTFFFSQAQNRIENDGEDFLSSLSSLLIIKSLSSILVSLACKKLISTLRMSEAKQKNAALIRIGAGMACSLICCITAYLGELLNYNVLVPQFILLGLMEGLAEEGLDDFLDYILATTEMDGLLFNDLVLSIGKFLSIPWILIFGSFWIGDTVKDSRLDLYYWALVIVNIPNLCFCWYFCTTLYAKEEDVGKEVELIPIDFQPEILTVQMTNSHDSYP